MLQYLQDMVCCCPEFPAGWVIKHVGLPSDIYKKIKIRTARNLYHPRNALNMVAWDHSVGVNDLTKALANSIALEVHISEFKNISVTLFVYDSNTHLSFDTPLNFKFQIVLMRSFPFCESLLWDMMKPCGFTACRRLDVTYISSEVL